LNTVKIVFLSIFFSTFLFGERLKSSYLFERDAIYSNDLVPNPKTVFEVLKIPSGSSVYKVYASKVVEEFQKNGIDVEPPKAPAITFFRAFKYDEKVITATIKKLFEDEYRDYNINIEDISVKPSSNIDLSGFKVEEIDTDFISLKRDTGSIKVTFQNIQGHRKSIFFRYDVKATIEVFVTTKDMQAGEPMLLASYRPDRVDFKNIIKEPALASDLVGVNARGYMKAGRILLKSSLKTMPDISRGDRVMVEDRSSGFVVQSFAEALDNGSKGEQIRVKLPNGKVTSVKVIGKNSVELK